MLARWRPSWGTRLLPRTNADFILRILLTVAVLITVWLTSTQGETIKSFLVRQPSKIDEFLQYGGPRNTSQRLDELRQGKKSFDWDDWLDLNITEAFHNGQLKKSAHPNIVGKSLSDLSFPPSTKSTSSENAMLGTLFTKYNMTIPSRIIVLGDAGNPETRGTFEVFNLDSGDDQKCHRQYGHKSCSSPPEITRSTIEKMDRTDGIPPASNILTVDVPSDAFVWDYESRKRDAESKLSGDNADAKSYATTLLEALSHKDEASKYFYEVNLMYDPVGYGTHYDWRFFRGVAGYEEHSKSIHHANRAWAQFADAIGLAYWFAHGSLLGWWWNGLTMPWDPDSDIQMPIEELDRLATIFNGTLVVTSPSEGSKMFYVDVSPWYVERTNENGQNNIDARFIDVSRGTYIDITGLAYTSKKHSVNCKNNLFYKLSVLSPLRRTLFEGTPAMVPNDNTKILRGEYRYFDNSTFNSWNFNQKVQLWQNDVSCQDYLKIFDSKAQVYCFPHNILPPEQCDYALFDTCDQTTIDLFNATQDITREHRVEFDLWDRTHSDSSEEKNEVLVNELAGLLDKYHPPVY